MSVFVDTSAIVALLDEGDPMHGAAEGAWDDFEAHDEHLITSNYVVLECTAVVQRRLGMDGASTLCESILPGLNVRYIDAELNDLAVQTWLAAARRQLSLVDVVSFLVMRREGVHRAFTLDPHFREQGFGCVPGVIGDE